MRDFDARLKALISTLDTADEPLADEIRALQRPRSPSVTASASPQKRSSRAAQRASQLSLRNIVLRVGRPVLAVVGDVPQIQCTDGESEVWRSRLQAATDRLQRASRAVGRIDVIGLPQLEYVGTGWLVERNTIATNRHVAREFGRRFRGRFAFKNGRGAKPIKASIDFLEEIGRPERLEFQIVEILHIEDEHGPDFALLRVEETSGGRELAAPIPLAASPARPAQQVAVIGYPARDRRAPDDQLMQSIYGGVYDKKRLAPGQVTEARSDVLLHDCSTLGGNSGSVLVDLATGEAVGLHFAGRFLEANYAVPAMLVAARLEQLRRPRPAGRPPGRPRPDPLPPSAVVTQTTSGGTPVDDEPIVEGVPNDYVGRAGYDPSFVGHGRAPASRPQHERCAHVPVERRPGD